jgi:hypothetical protein
VVLAINHNKGGFLSAFKGALTIKTKNVGYKTTMNCMNLLGAPILFEGTVHKKQPKIIQDLKILRVYAQMGDTMII